jgi:hypothetical protein
MKVARIFCLGMAVLFLSATVFALDIHTDFDHHVNFSKYHTYSWLKVKADNSLWQQRIKNDVDSALQGLGLKEVPSGGELEVTAVGTVQNQQEYQTFYNNFGPGWWWGGFGPNIATTAPVNYRVGTLVVDLYDPTTKRLIWRGTATNSLSGDPSTNAHRLEDAVNTMIATDKFPKPLGKLPS